MFGRSAALAFDDDPANRYLPWIVALMVYLAILALAGAFALGGTAERWQNARSDRLTVQVPPGGAGLDRVIELLGATPGITDVRRLERSELIALLEPWLGTANAAGDLPLPDLIDVTVARDAMPDLEVLAARLAEQAPGVSIDDHDQWMGRLAGAARAVQVMALALTALITGAATATLVFATRASLAVHRETIDVLHLIGAQDGFIARAFERRALGLGLRGGLIGLGLATFTYALLMPVTAGLEAPLMPRFDLSPTGFATLAALPLASAAIAMVTARLVVLKELAKLP